MSIIDLTDAEVTTELNKYSLERRLLALKTAELDILENGQTVWNGDKKLDMSNLATIRKAINETERAINIKKNWCKFVLCEVKY